MAYATETLQVVEPSQGNLAGVDSGSTSSSCRQPRRVRRDARSIYRHRLIVIRGAELNKRSTSNSREKGDPQIYFQDNYHHPDYPGIVRFFRNVKEGEGERSAWRAPETTGTPTAQFQEKPLSWTSIYPQIFPKKYRGTLYIDMAKVYQNLPDELRNYVDGATAVHAGQLRYKVKESDIDRSLKDLLEWINKEVPPVRHPAVIVHPITKEKILYMNSGFTVQLEGLTYEENQRRLKALFDFIEREEHVHTHIWDEGDLIIWDNRSLIHMSSTVPQGELSKPIGIYDGEPFYEGLQPLALTRSTIGGETEIAPEFVEKVLTPYRPHCRYLLESDPRIRKESPGLELAGDAANSRSMPRATSTTPGTLTRSSWTSCYNQLAYVHLAATASAIG